MKGFVSAVLAQGDKGGTSAPPGLSHRDTKSGAGSCVPCTAKLHTPKIFFPVDYRGEKRYNGFRRSKMLCGRYRLLHRGVWCWPTARPALFHFCVSCPYCTAFQKILQVIFYRIFCRILDKVRFHDYTEYRIEGYSRLAPFLGYRSNRRAGELWAVAFFIITRRKTADNTDGNHQTGR